MDDRSLAIRLGLLVRDLRRSAGWSQEAFADRCGLHRTYVGAIERGEKTVTIETASKLADAFDLRLSELFEHLEAQPAPVPSQPDRHSVDRFSSTPKATLQLDDHGAMCAFEQHWHAAVAHQQRRGLISSASATAPPLLPLLIAVEYQA